MSTLRFISVDPFRFLVRDGTISRRAVRAFLVLVALGHGLDFDGPPPRDSLAQAVRA